MGAVVVCWLITNVVSSQAVGLHAKSSPRLQLNAIGKPTCNQTITFLRITKDSHLHTGQAYGRSVGLYVRYCVQTQRPVADRRGGGMGHAPPQSS